MDREVVVNQIEGAKQVASTLEETKVDSIEDLEDMVESFHYLLTSVGHGDGDLFYKPYDKAVDKIGEIRLKYPDNPTKSKLKALQKSLLSAVKKYISELQNGLKVLYQEGK